MIVPMDTGLAVDPGDMHFDHPLQGKLQYSRSGSKSKVRDVYVEVRKIEQ